MDRSVGRRWIESSGRGGGPGAAEDRSRRPRYDSRAATSEETNAAELPNPVFLGSAQCGGQSRRTGHTGKPAHDTHDTHDTQSDVYLTRASRVRSKRRHRRGWSPRRPRPSAPAPKPKRWVVRFARLTRRTHRTRRCCVTRSREALEANPEAVDAQQTHAGRQHRNQRRLDELVGLSRPAHKHQLIFINKL
jgi:hypothetical protein